MAYDSGKKWYLSLVAGLLFLIIAAPFTFRLTDSLFGLFGLHVVEDGCPTIAGLLIHTVVFILITRLLMML